MNGEAGLLVNKTEDEKRERTKNTEARYPRLAIFCAFPTSPYFAGFEAFTHASLLVISDTLTTSHLPLLPPSSFPVSCI